MSPEPDVITGGARHHERAGRILTAGGMGTISSDLVEILRDFWRYRELLYELTLRDIRIRYKQPVMGLAWAVFMPILIFLAGLLLRYLIAYLTGSGLERQAVAAMAVKSLPWAFFVGAVGFATTSLTSNVTLITKVYFPREVLPLSATLAQAFDCLLATLVLILVLPFLGVHLSAALLWVPLLALILFLFTTAVTLVLSCGNLFFRDVKYIVQVLLTFGIFFTPVVFEPGMLGPIGARVMMLNPLSPVLEGLRLTVTQGHNLLVPLTGIAAGGREVLSWTPWYLAYAALWSVGGLLGSTLLFHRLEFVFAEYI